MLQEISAVITGIHASINLISSTLKAKADSAALDEVIKLQSQLAQIQDIALKMREEHMNLVGEVERLKAWDVEKTQYVLEEIRPDVFVYAKKPELMKKDERHPWLCPKCFNEGAKYFLTLCRDFYGFKVFMCPNCKNEFWGT